MNINLFLYRIFNKYNLIAFFVILIALFGFWAISSPAFENLPFTYDYEHEINVVGNTYEEAEAMRLFRLQLFSNFEEYTSEIPNVATLLTVLAPMTATIFCNEKNGLFRFKFIRGKKYRNTIISTMLLNALISSMWIFAAYFIYITIGLTFNSLTYTMVRRGLDFITENFYKNILFYIICFLELYNTLFFHSYIVFLAQQYIF